MSQTNHPSKTSDGVVITGAGLVSALGLSRAQTWQSVLRGQSGIAPLTAIESDLSPNKGGGQAPSPPEGVGGPREVFFLRMAIAEALAEAGVAEALPYPPTRCGWVLGTTLHGMRNAGEYFRSGELEALGRFIAGSTLSSATRGLGLHGFATTVCSACSSGLSSIALAMTLLEAGQLDMIVAGGYDTISEYAYGGFNSMRLMTDDRIRPFASNRSGLKLGEGYGVVVLERAADAERRGAPVLAQAIGVGESCDAFHLSKPHPEGDGAARAMQAALANAQVTPDRIGLIAAHATATPDNDAAEYAALTRTFDSQLSSIPVVAFKSHLGHTLGGAGAVELILSMSALGEQVVPPCAKGTTAEVAFEGLQLAVDEPRKAPISYSMNTSLGFGGSNTCLVLGAREACRSAVRSEEKEVAITGVGVVLPGVTSHDDLVALFSRSDSKRVEADTGGMDGLNIDHLLSARRARRLSEYVKLTLAATTLAYQDAGIEDIAGFGESCSAMLGTTHGSTTYCRRYYRQIVEDGIDAANPLLFAEGVPNAASAHLSTMLSIKGLCQTVIGTRTAGVDALLLAAERIRAGHWERAIVSAADEYDELINQAYDHFGLYRGAGERATDRQWPGFVTGCGAVTLVLEAADAAARRGARLRGIVRSTAGALGSGLASRGGANAVCHAVAGIGYPSHIITSANGTWLDRVEAAGLRRARRHARDRGVDCARLVTSTAGHLAECFSATPLVGLAAVLATGRMPACQLPLTGLPAVDRPTATEDFSVLGTDYAGGVTAARIEVRPDRPQGHS